MSETTAMLIGWILGLYYLLVGLALVTGGFEKRWHFFLSLIPFSLIVAGIYVYYQDIKKREEWYKKHKEK